MMLSCPPEHHAEETSWRLDVFHFRARPPTLCHITPVPVQHSCNLTGQTASRVRFNDPLTNRLGSALYSSSLGVRCVRMQHTVTTATTAVQDKLTQMPCGRRKENRESWMWFACTIPKPGVLVVSVPRVHLPVMMPCGSDSPSASGKKKTVYSGVDLNDEKDRGLKSLCLLPSGEKKDLIW